MGQPPASSRTLGNSPGPVLIRSDPDGTVVVRFMEGLEWSDPGSCLAELSRVIDASDQPSALAFEVEDPTEDTTLLVSIALEISRLARARGIEVQGGGLPETVENLVRIATAVPPREPEPGSRENFVSRLGRTAVEAIVDSRGFVEFLGELIISMGRFVRGRARFRRRDFWVTLQSCGVDALPIVALISILVGVILGFVGAVQLQRFGAIIYMADLVAISMAREMGCIMAGIIMSGRTGAAFAARIGSMNVNQEVDALESMGISPMEFLVVPRVLAMVMMMPLLTVFADTLGWFGGSIVALPMGIGLREYWLELIRSIDLQDVAIGVFKSVFFGIIVAATGCYYGLLSGRNSEAVGEAATKAVVAGITWIIIVDAVFAFALQSLGW